MNGRPDDEAPRIVVGVDGSGLVAVILLEDRG
jgi:hypothetical protein